MTMGPKEGILSSARETLSSGLDSLGRSFIAFMVALAVTICIAEVPSSLAVVVGKFGLGMLHDDAECWWTLFAIGVPIALLFQPGLISLATRSTFEVGCSAIDVFGQFNRVPRYLGASLVYLLAVWLSIPLIVGPIFFGAALSLYGFAIVEENAGIWDSFVRSWHLTRRYLHIIIPLQLVLGLVALALLQWHFYFIQVVMMIWFVFAAAIYGHATKDEPAADPSQTSWRNAPR